MVWLAHPVRRSSHTPRPRRSIWTPAGVRARARRWRLKQHQRIVSAHRIVIPQDGGSTPELAGPARDHRRCAATEQLTGCVRRHRAAHDHHRVAHHRRCRSPSSTASSTTPIGAIAVFIASATVEAAGFGDVAPRVLGGRRGAHRLRGWDRLGRRRPRGPAGRGRRRPRRRRGSGPASRPGGAAGSANSAAPHSLSPAPRRRTPSASARRSPAPPTRSPAAGSEQPPLYLPVRTSSPSLF